MRITNLMILLAIIAGVILVAQYVSQLKKSKNGNNFVSGGRVFLNWVLAIIFVVCIAGLAINAFHGGHQEAKSDQTKTEDVKYTAPKEELPAVSVKFNKKVTLNDDGQVKVKFKISPQTKITIRDHKSKQVVETFKASKGTKTVIQSYTFDFPGTYDIIAERDGKKVVKQLKVKDNDSATSSSSQVSSSSIISSSSPSSSVASSASSSDSSSSQQSSRSSQQSDGNTTGSSYRGSTGGSSVRRTQRGSYSSSTQSNSNTNTNTNTNNAGATDNGPKYEQPAEGTPLY